MTVRRFPTMLACGAFMGVTQGAYVLFGGRLDSFKEEDDEFVRKEVMRRTTRVPVEQTVATIGEGRSTFRISSLLSLLNLSRNSRKADHVVDIQPPGYEERRRERIKEKYGFEINPVKATVEGSE